MDLEIQGHNYQAHACMAKTLLTKEFFKGAQFLMFLRSLNDYRSRHTTLGDVLPSSQALAVAALLDSLGTGLTRSLPTREKW